MIKNQQYEELSNEKSKDIDRALGATFVDWEGNEQKIDLSKEKESEEEKNEEVKEKKGWKEDPEYSKLKRRKEDPEYSKFAKAVHGVE